MKTRIDLQDLFEEILGTINVYFQPPASVTMQYPCIVYNRESNDSKFAGNVLYVHKKRYQVTVIDKNPDSEIPDKILMLPLCSFSRQYKADNLNHDVYNLYY